MSSFEQDVVYSRLPLINQHSELMYIPSRFSSIIFTVSVKTSPSFSVGTKLT
ncbi:hypothetical protein BVRB_4g079170 isoform B [Beta vulgaris subsp. vulgaris]|nr:hypothetical protein BVRB_4g079170 isoform B [Beta vulgaris subsp. vulgaris]